MTGDRTQSDSEEMLNVDDSSATGDTDSVSEMLEILSHRPERRILSHLLHEDRPVVFESLVVAVAATDPSSGADEEDSNDLEGVCL